MAGGLSSNQRDRWHETVGVALHRRLLLSPGPLPFALVPSSPFGLSRLPGCTKICAPGSRVFDRALHSLLRHVVLHCSCTAVLTLPQRSDRGGCGAAVTVAWVVFWSAPVEYRSGFDSLVLVYLCLMLCFVPAAVSPLPSRLRTLPFFFFPAASVVLSA
jgi:hypothetical protein